MDYYFIFFRRYFIVPILASLLIVPFEIIQAEESLASIQLPFDFRIGNSFIRNEEPGSFAWDAIPAISSWLMNIRRKDSAETQSEKIKANFTGKSKTLNETLGVVPKKTKNDLIITTYFSRLCHQEPWDIGANARNRLMGLPACAPRQHSSILPLRIVCHRRLLEQKSAAN
ncbi:MAG: hypothetical protein GWO81_05770 [Verrucomicrobia bacterium]|nr:hypothetical protein [Verrucomicrobiota bacterium]